ncbi:MAG: phosphate ABC transporter permease subunit PstC [Myxococcaceae bacterium]|nr:phosphate ABC transporter permease subunit PstC [Myxococcaceae bacterium]
MPTPKSTSLPPAPSRYRARREAAIRGIVTAIGLSGIAALVLIIVFVAKEAVPLFTHAEHRAEASLGKMFTPQVVREGRPPAYVWQPVSKVPKVSMVPLALGTLKVTLVAMLFALPFGVAAAIFVAEFASRRMRELLKPALELLAGIPSVVLGFFALMVLASWLQDTFSLPSRLNALTAGVAMALAIIPVIFTVSEDALAAVPKSYREASLALGATRWETTWRVVMPAATPGLLAAGVLGFGRAIGETMIVLMASGNAAIVSASPLDSTRTFSATIAAEMGEVVFGSPHYSVLFFIGVQLFIFTFLLNALATVWVKRLVTGAAA